MRRTGTPRAAPAAPRPEKRGTIAACHGSAPWELLSHSSSDVGSSARRRSHGRLTRLCSATNVALTPATIGGVEFEVLGPLRVVEGGRDLTPARPKQRALLATLLLHREEVVPGARLIEALWGET